MLNKKYTNNFKKKVIEEKYVIMYNKIRIIYQ